MSSASSVVDSGFALLNRTNHRAHGGHRGIVSRVYSVSSASSVVDSGLALLTELTTEDTEDTEEL